MRSANPDGIVFFLSCIQDTEELPRLVNLIEVCKARVAILLVDDVPAVRSRVIRSALHLEETPGVLYVDCGYDSKSMSDPNHPEESMLAEIFSTALSKYKLTDKRLIIMGSSQQHLATKKWAFLYFHVGEALPKKFGNLIPLNAQYESGIMNVLDYFSRKGFVDEAFEYGDILGFIKNSVNFYQKLDAPTFILQRHDDVCKKLLEKFPGVIAGFFATGFPFYLFNDGQLLQQAQTPQSILDYLSVQLDYFKRKLISAEDFVENAAKEFSQEEISHSFGLIVDRNEFDKDEYIKEGIAVPVFDAKYHTLHDFYEYACFDIRSDYWPCYYCATLQFKDYFPTQRITKITGEMCLYCNQTSVMLRNIMGCATDMDIIVIVHDQKRHYAELIKEFIIKESGYYLYDMDFNRTFRNEGDGPIDLFVTTQAELLDAFQSLLGENWLHASFSAVALWSQTILDLTFILGDDFPLAFEPRFVQDAHLLQEFRKIRKTFASKHDHNTVIEQLRTHSLARRQMLSNPSIVENMRTQLLKWEHQDLKTSESL